MQRSLVPAAFVILFAAFCHAEEWTEFRGPNRDGHSTAKNLPIEWSDTNHVVWKSDLPGEGWSSPVLHQGFIYLTAAVPLKEGEPDLSLRLLKLQADNGEIVRNAEVFKQDGQSAPKIHSKNSHASPTPILAGGRVYVHFGHQGTACLDLDCETVWTNRDVKYAPVHGNGGSPILVRRALVFSCDGATEPFVVALDRDNGQVLWKTPRNQEAPKKFAFSTPQLIEIDCRQQIISPGSNCVGAYDPATGQELWRVRYQGYSVIPRPVYGQGLLFLSTGYDSPTLMAIRPDGAGDVTDTHVAWKLTKGAPHTPSPLLVGEELYLVSDRGIATCLDAKTGAVHWTERVKGNYSASPLYADGRIYLQNETGDATVLQPGKEFKQLAVNTVTGRTLASYAVADGTIYIRTDKQLLRIGQR